MKIKYVTEDELDEVMQQREGKSILVLTSYDECIQSGKCGWGHRGATIEFTKGNMTWWYNLVVVYFDEDDQYYLNTAYVKSEKKLGKFLLHKIRQQSLYL